MLTNQLRERESYDNMDNTTSHERAYKFRFYPDATQESIMESMRKNDYHTISASNDNHMKLMRTERKPPMMPAMIANDGNNTIQFRRPVYHPSSAADMYSC